ncbi:MAG TPA: arsinothricin resistance N-acetyltransferase ArsN1 family A [Nitrososphaerales archaeon]|nr:arsinothricin resistance N-acetyltransferase ArsN1 family A [Nitrososphaerales archaeon]
MKSTSYEATAVLVRRAVTLDAPQIAEIYNQGIEEREATFETETRTGAEMRRWLLDHDWRHPVLVASVKGKPKRIVGWASVSAYRARKCYSGVGEFSVYVRRGYRGKGIGKGLVSALIGESARVGYWKLLSRVFEFNKASRRLCKGCGFREVGVYEKHGKLDGKWIDVVIVERLIPKNLG